MTSLNNTNGQPNFSGKAGSFDQLTTQQSKGAVAFARSGLGEEVLPGFFILEKNLALAIAALRIHPDRQFLEKEVQLAREEYTTGKVPYDAMKLEVASLLQRLESKIDTRRGVFLVGSRPAVASNAFNVVLPQLPPFEKFSDYISDVVEYVAQPSNIYVIDGAQWEKNHLFQLILAQVMAGDVQIGGNLIRMYEFARETLEKSPDVLARLQREAVVPEINQETNVMTFWSKLFTTSTYKSNESLKSWLRSLMPWPSQLDNLSTDGAFLTSFLPVVAHFQGDRETALALLAPMESVHRTGTHVARIVDAMHGASRARVVRSN